MNDDIREAVMMLAITQVDNSAKRTARLSPQKETTP